MWIEIFRTGKHTDAAGNTREWTEDDLDKIVENYDPKSHEAPIVIGHPKDNAPAYGWVESLKREGNVLKAKLKQLIPEFVDMVKKGLFKKRSISLYPDLTLRHVGFLGAMPPAVKGLKDIAFQENDKLITIEFEDQNQNSGDKPMKQGNQQTQNTGQQSMQISETVQQQFNEFQQQLKQLQQQNEELIKRLENKDKEIKNLKDRVKTMQSNARNAELAQFVDGLIQDGRLLPKDREHVLAFMNALDAAGEYQFSDGNETVRTPYVDGFKQFLSGLPKQIYFTNLQASNDNKKHLSPVQKIAAELRNN